MSTKQNRCMVDLFDLDEATASVARAMGRAEVECVARTEQLTVYDLDGRSTPGGVQHDRVAISRAEREWELSEPAAFRELLIANGYTVDATSREIVRLA